MLNSPFSPWPSFTAEEAEVIQEVLLSNRVNYWTGNEGKLFEEEFARYCGVDYAVALANGSVALEAALKALGIGPGDEVIVPCRTFIASAACVVNVGAVPVFADIDRDSQNITVDTLRPLVNQNTRALICVHLAGWPCDMDAINSLAAEQGLYVIEDCAQAHGARYKGRSVGSLGHIAAWSFCQDKIMTTGGEGGMVTTDDPALWSKVWSYKDHGKSREAVYKENHPPGFRWLHKSIGTNLRITEMQAAIGRIQLHRMPDWHQRRQDNAAAILDTATNLPGLRVPVVPAEMTHAWYKCYLFVEPDKLLPDWTRDRLIEAINAQGVPCFSGSCPEVYREKAFTESGLAPANPLPVARELGETSLMFLVHPTLTEIEIDKTCAVLTEVVREATS